MSDPRAIVHALHRRLPFGMSTPAGGLPDMFWGICQGAPTGTTGHKVIQVAVNGAPAANAIPMGYDSGYAAGVAPAANDVVWGLVVGSDYFVIGKRA